MRVRRLGLLTITVFSASIRIFCKFTMSISSVTKNYNWDLRELIKQKWEGKKFFYSFELVSCQDQDIYRRFFTEIKEYFPLFYTLTWHKNFKINNLDKNLSQMPKNTLLHLTARGKTEKEIIKILDKALELGIYNLFVLRGDTQDSTGDFFYAVDLVRFVKKNYNDKFSIAVAGYPDRHPESVTAELEFCYLKEKVDAGADFIITQIVFDSKVFINFVKDCRENGIDVPILAGVMPIVNYCSLMKIVNICRLVLPKPVLKDLEEIKEDDFSVQKYGIELIIKIIVNIINDGFYGFHFFTFNKSELVLKILNKLNPYLNNDIEII